MTPPFSIEELRANIGDDRDTERQLLATFIETAQESLRLLESRFPSAADPDYGALWKTHLHQIKGAALNLGAVALAGLAAQAQHGKPHKALLSTVEAEFRRVEAYIKILTA